jgi:hypothetical protein
MFGGILMAQQHNTLRNAVQKSNRFSLTSIADKHQ